VGLHLDAKIGNHSLRGFRQQLRQRERRHALNERGADYCEDNWQKELPLMLADNIVD
jgi:hypothetical protein